MEGNSAVNRTVQYFQYRIQQAISLCDEEIDRLCKTLSIYKARILETREKIGNTDREITTAEEVRLGEEKRREAAYQAAIARLRSQYHQKIQDLQKAHETEIETLQQNFEESLANLTESEEGKLSKSIEALDEDFSKCMEETQKYQEQIDRFLEETTNFDAEEKDNFEEVTQSVIEELQATLETRNEERFENLNQSKEKLSQCVDAIDSMTRAHTIRIQEIQNRIQATERNYESSVQDMKSQHEYKLRILKVHLAECENTAATLSKAARKLEKDNQNQLRETLSEMDKLRAQASIRPDTENSEAMLKQKGKLAKLQKEVASLEEGLKAQEEILTEKRKENEAVKREIGKVKHEIGFAGRIKI